MFSLHPQLAQDCFVIGQFSLSQLLLMNDCQYPWFILVPQRDNVTEIYQLSAEDQAQLWRESAALSQTLARHFAADKMNVAVLGNVVPQLHMHHIVRYRHDPAWPAPVWGKLPPRPYSDKQLQHLLGELSGPLGQNLNLG
ncbi:MAG: HIT domain-containing protein [Gammaproteobacteria bacterium]|jgi:diadenosine tetraphosphate (Ap4A) HIT family hydrolase